MSSKISALTPITTPTLTALFPLVNDPAGTPANKVMTASGLRGFITGWYNVKDYGALGDGTTDDYTAVFAAITTAQLVGGTVYFPVGTYRINSQIIIPNDGASVPAQRPLRFVGDGCLFNGRGGGIYGGTVLDLRYSSTGAKIESRGLGSLEITGLTLTDLGTSTNPFVFISNTSFFPHDMAVIGNPTKANATCDQDAFILGGATASLYDGSADGSFQGYGTVIEKCYFGRIRRGVYLRCAANAVVIQNNTWWSTCGAPSTSYAAIEFAPTSPQTCIGNVVSNNLIEMVGYYYGIKAALASVNSFIANNFYDPTTATAYYRFETTAQFNIIVAGYSDDTKPLVSDNGSNTIINSHQSQNTVFPQPVQFTHSSGPTFNYQINVKGSPGILAQPATALGDSWIPFKALRSAAEASNPGTKIFEMQQGGSLTLGGTNAGTIIIQDQAGTQVSGFNASLKNWFASGSGGQMTQDSGTGGSYFDHKNYGVRFYDHNSGPLRVIIGAGLDGIKFGAASDANIYRSAANVLKTDSRLWGALGVVTNTGLTAARPASPQAGQMYFDTTLTKPVWYTGSVWVDATGTTV